MNKALKSMLVWVSVIVATLVLVPVVFLLWMTLADFRPEQVVKIHASGKSLNIPIPGDTLAILTWNIGYCGLGKEMDFFYDGGTGVRPARKDYLRNQDGVLKTLFRQGDLDFFMLQEVDQNARRSYHYDQVGALSEILPDHCLVFAKNYEVPFVPVPLTNPMGKVTSGIVSLAKFTPRESSRHATVGDASWPMGLFMLDRCFILQRFELAAGGELVLINTHNSAFDDGSRRQQQLAVLKETMIREFEAGNFVVAGGDWNLNPPGYSPSAISAKYHSKLVEPAIGEDFLPEGWQWAFDASLPTNRDVITPYHEGVTLTTIIDFFVCSPNVKVLEVNTMDLDFEESDHHPVIMKFQAGK